MYFVKARKQPDEQDVNDREKSNRIRYQRSDSARLLLQAVPPALQTQTSVEQKQEFNNVPVSGSVSKHGEFRPDELPDGACYRPKKEIPLNAGRPLSPAAAGVSTSAGSGPGTQQGTQQVEASSVDDENKEWLRPAEYIGTFSVSGSDKQAREKQMEIQLQQMRGVSTVTPVHLLISVDGVKVMNVNTKTAIMEHSLKRIWYATCDPEFCQFSFLAREPKTSAEVQYCHAFLTNTSDEAEELISLMGNAFKATVPPSSSEVTTTTAAVKKPPTFHELIEQQVQEQQAKFREIEKESKLALQRKLTEIATPTPFSEKVQHRMGARRFSDGGGVDPGSSTNKMWTKQLLGYPTNQHGAENDNNFNNNKNANMNNIHRRSEIPVHSTSSPQSSPFKRNSVPPQFKESIIGSSTSSVPSSPAHPLSAQAIRESLGSKPAGKFKGSPVTALKNEIDKRLLLDDSAAFPMSKHDIQPNSVVPSNSKSSMANRPLPSPPEESNHEPRGRSRPGRSGGDVRVRRSLDDNNLPMGQPDSGQVRMRNSPRRGQARPMSEIAVGSPSAALFQQQRQSLLQNFASSFNSPRELEAAAAAAAASSSGLPPPAVAVPTSVSQDRISNYKRNSYSGGSMNMYVPPPNSNMYTTQQSQPPVVNDPAIKLSNSNHNNNSPSKMNHHRGKVVERRERSGGSDGGGRKRSDPALPPYAPPTPPTQPQQQQQDEPEMYEELVEDDGNGVSAGGGAGMEVLRYQNGSPFYHGDYDGTGRGLESLMNLDRSHIHDITLRNAPWYQAGLAREIALDILQQEDVGAFIVRDSSTHPGCFALSVRVPKFENSSGISHYLILRTHRGVKLKGLEKEWSTLHALVTHHTVMREMLPCTLRLPKKTAPPMLADDIRSSGDGMERGGSYTDMATAHAGGGGGGGHPPVLRVLSGGKNF